MVCGRMGGWHAIIVAAVSQRLSTWFRISRTNNAGPAKQPIESSRDTLTFTLRSVMIKPSFAVLLASTLLLQGEPGLGHQRFGQRHGLRRIGSVLHGRFVRGFSEIQCRAGIATVTSYTNVSWHLDRHAVNSM